METERKGEWKGKSEGDEKGQREREKKVKGNGNTKGDRKGSG